MFASRWVVSFFLLSLSVRVSVAEEAFSAGRVYLFPETRFRGEPLVVEVGQSQTNLHSVRQSNRDRWNDAISSLKIEGPVRVVIYGDANYGGERLELRKSVSDLTAFPHGPSKIETWDDRISSLKVERLPGSSPSTSPSSSTPQPEPLFRTQREADRAIQAAFRDLLGREVDYDGLQNYRRRLLDQGWSDSQLRSALRDSGEFKNRDFDGMVRKAYTDLLGHDPSPADLSHHRRRLQEGLADGDLRADLKRSDEFKDRVAREIVAKAYQDLLGRAPDESGMATYLRLIRTSAWSEQRVRDALRASEEYRNRPRS